MLYKLRDLCYTLSSLKKNGNQQATEGGERVKKNPYIGLTYPELMELSMNVTYGVEARMLHKALKKYKSGLPMFMRYPNAPLVVSICSLLLVLLGRFLSYIHQ